MILRNRKAEKELQLIFGLFVLLIISLVVLSLFFNFTKKSTEAMTVTATEYQKSQEKNKAISECTSLCDAIGNGGIGAQIDFCRQTESIDFNKDGIYTAKVESGIWDFCEETIPCFILMDPPCKNDFDGAKCKEILGDPENNRLSVLADLSRGKPQDNCKLNATNPVLATATVPAHCDNSSNANWRCKYGYFDKV